MKRQSFIVSIFMLMTLVFTSVSSGTIVYLSAFLDGSQENPPNAMLGTGKANIILDDFSGDLSWEITFSGLSGSPVAAHFHGPAPVGVNAGVLVPILDLSSPMIGTATLTPTQITYMLNELMYINIHTASFPGGEIRGQVSVVPEPGTLILLSIGAMGIAVFSFKKKKIRD